MFTHPQAMQFIGCIGQNLQNQEQSVKFRSCIWKKSLKMLLTGGQVAPQIGDNWSSQPGGLNPRHLVVWLFYFAIPLQTHAVENLISKSLKIILFSSERSWRISDFSC